MPYANIWTLSTSNRSLRFSKSLLQCEDPRSHFRPAAKMR
jgi:hypothetical protein